MARGELYPDWHFLAPEAADSAIRAKAELVLAYAIATAPVDTGAYKRSLRMEALGSAVSGYRISANVDYAVYVEFGTRKMDAYHTLATALDAAKGLVRQGKSGKFRRVRTRAQRISAEVDREDRDARTVKNLFGDEG